MTVEDRLAALGLTLPPAPPPAASYRPFVQVGSLLYVAGQIPQAPDGTLLRGRLGDDLDVAAGRRAAERCALAVVAQVKAATGDLARVDRFVKLTVFVNSTPHFTDQPEVANGASELIVAVFGERGHHARSAVGVASLPRGVAVEVDAVVALG
ncbi:MAG: RidA family protein [Sphingomonadaceae bacterium]|uniref:RidA family protein n=1 Tax=Thermaurantiacus sp. TaxID=2820283 RepID=UPI00298EDAAB|nr:RidA family protein [Thermaurantiacus sp.]MCS6986367.1 RidA family protein [Sphingomonadaceae bacterium]MDW8414371.1 RidA family protein [Thermaurantiacus sp.]